MVVKSIISREQEKRKIYQAIFRDMEGNDRYPYEIIRDKPFNGNEEEYLVSMANYHNIF